MWGEEILGFDSCYNFNSITFLKSKLRNYAKTSPLEQIRFTLRRNLVGDERV